MESAYRNVALIGKLHEDRVAHAVTGLASYLWSRNARVLLEDSSGDPDLLPDAERLAVDEISEAADLIIAVGGDGTMLHAARLTAGSDTPILGINLGRLGFLADVSPDDATERLDQLLSGHHRLETRAMLKAVVHSAAGTSEPRYALNDFVVQRWEVGRMIEFETWVDDRFVSSHRADGLVVASPTGSTAYALSSGGPIVHPAVDALVMVPICPHTLSDRPLVLGSDCRIEVRMVQSRHADRAQLTGDAAAVSDLDAGDRIEISAGEREVKLLHPEDHDYFRILRDKLHWARGAGEDVPR